MKYFAAVFVIAIYELLIVYGASPVVLVVSADESSGFDCTDDDPIGFGLCDVVHDAKTNISKMQTAINFFIPALSVSALRIPGYHFSQSSTLFPRRASILQNNFIDIIVIH